MGVMITITISCWGYLGYDYFIKEDRFGASTSTRIIEKHPSLKGMVVELYKDGKITRYETGTLESAADVLEIEERRLRLIEDKKELGDILNK